MSELILPPSMSNGHRSTDLLERSLKEVTTQLTASENSRLLEHERFREAITDLEIALEDRGWVRMRGQAKIEFTRDGIERIIENSRLMFLKNPLIRRAVKITSFYVFGQGVQISAKDATVNEVVQRFIDDRKNRDELFSHRARTEAEQALQYDGNLFFALFTNPVTGRVIVRSIVVDQIREVVKDPEDSADRWYYKRVWEQQPFDPVSGRLGAPVQKQAYYPDWRIFYTGPPDANGNFPGKHPDMIGDTPVMKTPVMHVAVGGLRDWDFGIPDYYAALDWARAYKVFLENWHSIVQSLSRFAWKATAPTAKVDAMARKLNSSITVDNEVEANPSPVTGAAWVSDAETTITPIPKTGATVGAEDGRMLRLMVASATDLPDTILAGDPDMGNLATAKTLDRPTELSMRDRQYLWQDVIRDLCEFAVQADLHATGGTLAVVRNSVAQPGELELGPDIDSTIEVKFPPILEQDKLESIKAVVEAATLGGHPAIGTIPPEALSRMLLVILETEDVDAVIDELFPEEDAGLVVEERAAMTSALKDLKEALKKATAPKQIVLHESPTDAAAQTGVMVGWFLPDEIAQALAVPGGEPADQLHLTLAFLGNIDELGTDSVARLTSVVSAFAASEPTLNGVLSGIGRFQGSDPEPVWATIDMPGLNELRASLVHRLQANGLQPKTDHGFAPHITLCWVPAGMAAPVSTVPQLGVSIDTLTVAAAGELYSYPLLATLQAVEA